MLHLGLPDRFVEHGETAQLHASLGLDCEGIIAAIAQRERRTASRTGIAVYLPEPIALQ